MCFDFLNAYLQPWFLSLFSCELQRMLSCLFFVTLCYSSSFPIPFFHSWVLISVFQDCHGLCTTHMDGVFVELILEVGIFLNNFELWQSVFEDTYLVAGFLYSSWIFNVFCDHHSSFKGNEGLFFTVLLQVLRQNFKYLIGEIVNIMNLYPSMI